MTKKIQLEKMDTNFFLSTDNNKVYNNIEENVILQNKKRKRKTKRKCLNWDDIKIRRSKNKPVYLKIRRKID